MEKEYSSWRRLIIFRAPTPIIYLLFLSLLYFSFFSRNSSTILDEWKQWSSNSKASLVGTRKVFVKGIDHHEQSFKSLFSRLVTGEEQTQLEATGFACHTAPYSEVCVANRPVRIDTHMMKIYLPSDNQTIPQSQRVVRPYARRDDKNLLNAVTPVHMLHDNNVTQPACNYTHIVPALIFSSAGFVGNQFHEFNEVILPLFLTSRHFKSRVRFVVVDYNPKFVTKYQEIISQLSDYEIINPATNGSDSVHCFPGAVAGLHFHAHLAINSTDVPIGCSMPDFKQFLREAYNLKTWTVSEIEKPTLMLISRKSSRTFLNEDEMVGLMEELGFRVILARPGMMRNLKKFSQVVNSCSVIVGIHGAGLTSELYLPTGAVTIQVVPLGLQWASTAYFAEPAEAMGVHYLEYKIKPEESSLFKLYGKDHPIIVDPESMFATKGHQFGRSIYTDGQHVRIDLVRFRKTLVEALGFLRPQVI